MFLFLSKLTQFICHIDCLARTLVSAERRIENHRNLRMIATRLLVTLAYWVGAWRWGLPIAGPWTISVQPLEWSIAPQCELWAYSVGLSSRTEFMHITTCPGWAPQGSFSAGEPVTEFQAMVRHPVAAERKGRGSLRAIPGSLFRGEERRDCEFAFAVGRQRLPTSRPTGGIRWISKFS